MVSADRAALLRRRTIVYVVVAAVFGIGTFVLAELTFSGRLGFAHLLLVVLFVLPLIALVALVLAIVSGVQASRYNAQN